VVSERCPSGVGGVIMGNEGLATFATVKSRRLRWPLLMMSLFGGKR